MIFFLFVKDAEIDCTVFSRNLDRFLTEDEFQKSSPVISQDTFNNIFLVFCVS